MSSSGDKPMNTRDFRRVYVRRRRNIIKGSGKVVRDLDLNAPPPAELSMPKTDGSFEIRDDNHVSPASNLFEREAIIPRRKRSTTNCKPRHYQPPPSADHHESSSAAALATSKEWRCPACCRIDDDELSMPIKYLKNFKLRKGLKKLG